MTAEDFKTLTRDDARLRVLQEFDAHFRPELCETERAVVLEVLDSEWKDHLYHMGQVRDSIGLVTYAGKDPKTEYKREGRQAFNAMWDQISERATTTMFRLERESSAFVSSLWQISAATHEEYRDDQPAAPQQGQEQDYNYGPEPGQSQQAIDPIRNDMPKVGRNDPCTCGSGKKYKKCCGRGM